MADRIDESVLRTRVGSLNGPGRRLISRRGFLKGSAASVAAGATAREFLRNCDHLSLEIGRDWLSLRQNGAEKFRLEATRFQGRPKLWKEEGAGRLAFGIRNARFPGTEIAADLICEIWNGTFGPQVLLTVESMGLALRGYARDWFDRDGLTGYLSSSATLIAGPDLSITLQPSPVSFSSAGSLTFRGHSCAVISYSHHHLECEEIILRTAGLGDSVLRGAASRRTDISIFRGSVGWPLRPPADGWTYTSANDASIFDRLEIEAHESTARRRNYAVTAMRTESRPPVQLVLDEPLIGTDGRSSAFFLRGPIFTHNLDAQTSVTLASLIRPARMKMGALTLRFTDPPSRAAMRIAVDQTGVSGSFSPDAALHGRIREAIITPQHTDDSWPVEVAGSRKMHPGKKPARHSSVKMSQGNPVLSGSIRFRVFRPADFLDLRFELVNVTHWVMNGNIYIKKQDTASPALMVVNVSPQTIAEQTFPSGAPSNVDVCATVAGSSTPKAVATLPKESRISFEILTQGDTQAIVDLDFLLGWQKYPLHLSGGQLPAEGAENVTALELPAGLIFSPMAGASFATPKPHPAGLLGDTEDDTYSTHTGDTYRLWTARLTKDNANLIAVGYEKQNGSIQYALNDSQRQAIAGEVTSSSPLPVQHLVVSAAGGWVKGQAQLNPTFCPTTTDNFLNGVSLNISGGIEQHEEVSYPIVLIPTGHKGSLVVSTRRQWCRDGADMLHAPLITRYRIVFSETVCPYNPYWISGKGYPLPFDQIEISIRETPTLFPDDASAFVTNDFANCNDVASTPYWATVAQPPNYDGASTIPFSFPVICTDRDGVTHQTTMSMIVAAETRAYSCLTNYIAGLITAYKNGAGVTGQVIPNFNGESLSYATSSKPGNAAYPTGIMYWSAASGKQIHPVQYPLVPWAPQMVSSAITLDTTAGFSQSGGAASQNFRYSQLYCDHPFDLPATSSRAKSETISSTAGNLGEILLTTTDVPPALNFYAKLGGGLAQPSTGIAALSRSVGNVFTNATSKIDDTLSSITDLASGAFNAVDAFAEAAQLLGAVELSEILVPVADILQNVAQVPKLAAQELAQLTGDINDVTTQLNTLQTALTGITLSGALSNVFNAIAPQVAYIEALVFEQVAQSAQYVNAQPDVQYLQSLLSPDPATAQKEMAALQAQLSLALDLRIQSTTSLALNGQTTLITLNRMRDYLLNAALQASNLQTAALQVVGAFSADLDSIEVGDATAQQDATTLQADLQTLTRDLVNFKAAFQNVLTQVASAYMSVATSVTAILSAVNAGLSNPLSIVSSLQQLASLLTTLKNPLSAIDPSSIVSSYKNISDDVTELLSDFNALVTLAGQQPQLTTAAQAISAQIQATQTTLQRYFTNIQASFTNSTFQTNLASLNTFYNTLVTTANNAGTSITAFLQQLTNLQQIRVSYDYDAPLQTNSTGLFIPSKGGNPADLSLHTSLTVNVPGLSPNPPSPDLIISATINNFTLLLVPGFSFLTVGFTNASFTSTNGSAPVVSCKLDSSSIQFIGPLNFVVGLASAISLPDDLSVQQTPGGVSIGYDLSLPSIETGAFMLSNLSLNSGVALDFTGGAIRVLFGFADPNQHFIMTYTIFGGGGYLGFSFAPTLGKSSFDISGALEFGAEAALDFGVASGDLYVFGGFLFNMTGDELDLGGYLRAGGDLDVLDLISVSVEFSMSLTYEDRGGTAWLVGECDITVDVDILLVIDTSVDIRMYKEFSNASAN
jgi:hypothetical protein